MTVVQTCALPISSGQDGTGQGNTENNVNETFETVSKNGLDIEYFVLALNYLKSAEKMYAKGKEKMAAGMLKDAIEIGRASGRKRL